ncbi:MAG TPA: hypothetical protein VJ719_03295 [Chthoniobacterales bacterium]|nr:hypothetical protein [Chthoniobacterales bacterium]
MVTRGKSLVTPTGSGQPVQIGQTVLAGEIGRRSSTTQPIDLIGCRPGTKLVDLRALLAERFPSSPPPPPASLITGVPALDQTIGGGLCKGGITELISPNLSAGSASLLAAMVHAACRDRYFMALIDGTDSFDPQPIGNQALGHLLWVRCQTTVQAIKSADLLLRDGNFPLVIVDLVLNAPNEVRKIQQTSWYRLQRLVESTSTAFVVLTRSNTVSSAQVKIVLENGWNLRAIEQENPETFLQFRVQRMHRAFDTKLTSAAG